MKRSQKIFETGKNSEGNRYLLVRYTPYHEDTYIDGLDFIQKAGKVANFIFLSFRTDEFAKKNYSLRERFRCFRYTLAADELDRKTT